jgi:hypothetical protein
MKPAFCKIHNVQAFIQTSPRLAEAIEYRENLSIDEVVSLKILSYGEIYEYKIDYTFVKEFNFALVDGVVMLRDRDKTENKMNDRLLIQKVTRAMKWVCPLCLSEIFDKGNKGSL